MNNLEFKTTRVGASYLEYYEKFNEFPYSIDVLLDSLSRYIFERDNQDKRTMTVEDYDKEITALKCVIELENEKVK